MTDCSSGRGGPAHDEERVGGTVRAPSSASPASIRRSGSVPRGPSSRRGWRIVVRPSASGRSRRTRRPGVAALNRPRSAAARRRGQADRTREDRRRVRGTVEHRVHARPAALDVGDQALLDRDGGLAKRPPPRRRGAHPRAPCGRRSARGRSGLARGVSGTGAGAGGEPQAEHAEAAVAELDQVRDGGARRPRARRSPRSRSARSRPSLRRGRVDHDGRGPPRQRGPRRAGRRPRAGRPPVRRPPARPIAGLKAPLLGVGEAASHASCCGSAASRTPCRKQTAAARSSNGPRQPLAQHDAERAPDGRSEAAKGPHPRSRSRTRPPNSSHQHGVTTCGRL